MADPWFISQQILEPPKLTFADRLSKLSYKTFGELLGKQGIYYDLVEIVIKTLETEQTLHIPAPALIKAKNGVYIFDSMLSLPITKYRDDKFFKCFICDSRSFYAGFCPLCWEGYIEEQEEWCSNRDYYSKLKVEFNQWQERKSVLKTAILDRFQTNPRFNMLWSILIEDVLYHIESISYVPAIRRENA